MHVFKVQRRSRRVSCLVLCALLYLVIAGPSTSLSRFPLTSFMVGPTDILHLCGKSSKLIMIFMYDAASICLHQSLFVSNTLGLSPFVSICLDCLDLSPFVSICLQNWSRLRSAHRLLGLPLSPRNAHVDLEGDAMRRGSARWRDVILTSEPSNCAWPLAGCSDKSALQAALISRCVSTRWLGPRHRTL